MAYYDLVWYCNFGDGATTGYYAVPKRPQNTAVVAGQLCRQFTTPAVNSERVWICTIAGTTANTTDASWTTVRGSATVDGTATWREVTGTSAVNGDNVNTPLWAQVKAGGISLGNIIRRSNNASYQMCIGAGSMGATEPAFSDVAGAVTADSTSSWVCLGPVGNFSGGMAPHARLFNACAATWFAPGNTVYIGDNHLETNSGIIEARPTGSATTVNRIICHNHSGNYPPTSADLRQGATLQSLSNNNILLGNSSPVSTYYFYGLIFISNGTQTSMSFAGSSWLVFERCSFQFSNTANATVQFNSPHAVIWNNVTMKFAGAGQGVMVGAHNFFMWQNTGPVLLSGSVIPVTSLVNSSAASSSHVVLEALDLSQITGPLFSNSSYPCNSVCKDCLLSAATAAAPVAAFGAGSFGMTHQLVRSDSGVAGFKSSRYTIEGIETTETSVLRVGGAVDPTGQPQSRKIVTAAPVWLKPFRAEPYAVWNDRTGAPVTVTVCGVTGGALPLSDDIWLEVEYFGSSTTTLGTIVTTTKADVLAVGTPVPADVSAWNGQILVPSTLDPGTAAAVTLSNGNLTATNTGTTATEQGARVAPGVGGQTSGKFYFEVIRKTTSGSQNMALGVGTTASTYTGMGGSPYAVVGATYRTNGAMLTNGVSAGSLPAQSVGQAIGVAVDLDNRQIWFRHDPAATWNASGTANPSTNVGGIALPAGTMVPFVIFGGPAGVAGEQYDTLFGTAAFAGVVPPGFYPGWGSAATKVPFKLTVTLSSPPPGLRGYIHVRVRVAKPNAIIYIDPQITMT